MWFARVTGFQGDSSVPNADNLNVDDYPDDAVKVTIRWFWSAAEVTSKIEPLPKTDNADRLMAAMGADEYLAGMVEQDITCGTIEGNVSSLSSTEP